MSNLNSDFDQFIQTKPFVSLPGGFGSTLQLYGYRMRPESWSGEANLHASDLLQRVHQEFQNKSVDIHTTNTFRTSAFFMNRMLEKFGACADDILCDYRDHTPIEREFRNGGEELAYWASKRAVDTALAVQASSNRQVRVAGSIGPINDTHSNKRHNDVPLADLRPYHIDHANLLKELGVEALFDETLPTLPEVIAASEAAAATGLPYVVSLVLNPETGKLFDGTTIRDAVKETISPSAILFNCTPAFAIGPALDTLLECYDGIVGAYPNGGGGPASDNVHWDHDESTEAIGTFVDTILSWRAKDSRVKMLGGCCGASPAYIQTLNDALALNSSHTVPRRRFVAEAVDIDMPALTCGCAGAGRLPWLHAAPSG